MWILKLNALGQRSERVYQQLGQIVPTRLRKAAELWYYSLPNEFRQAAEVDWGYLREAIGAFYMNRAWLERQKSIANNARFRDASHSSESPSEYFIRKSQLLKLVHSLSDSELIMEIMNGAPTSWNTILTTHLYSSVIEFQSAIKFHENLLMSLSRGDRDRDYRPNRPVYQPAPSYSGAYNQGNRGSPSGGRPYRSNARLAGWSPSLPAPKFPRDDSVVSKGKTPEQKGARPCRHCGSGKHWDYDCPHARKEAKNVRARLATASDDYLRAQEEYENLYYDTDSDGDDFQSCVDEETHQDFRKPLQSRAPLTQATCRSASALGGSSRLGGSNSAPGSTAKSVKATATSYRTTSASNQTKKSSLDAPKMPLGILPLKRWMSPTSGHLFPRRTVNPSARLARSVWRKPH